MNQTDSDDDTSDEDFIPGGEDCAQLSEVESDGDPEDNCNSEDESSSKHRKRKSKTKTKRNKKSKIDVSNEEIEEDIPPEVSEESQKKKTDSLWADFLKDTDFKPKSKATTDIKPTVVNKSVTPIINKSVKEKPKASTPKIFEFAGEIVSIPEKNTETTSETQSTSQVTESPIQLPVAKSRGIASVLSQLGKKQKITTLEKSKLDWDRFKTDENIADELHAFNKGKNGYLERQDFLERADLRQFEIEKKARSIQRSNRS